MSAACACYSDQARTHGAPWTHGALKRGTGIEASMLSKAKETHGSTKRDITSKTRRCLEPSAVLTVDASLDKEA